MAINEQGRIPPLTPPYTPEVAEMLQKWMPPDATEPLMLFRVLVQNPDLMSRMRPLGAGFLGKSSLLNPIERELVINRVCFLCACEYEWGVHVAAFGAALEISSEKLMGTAHLGEEAKAFNPRERLLIQAADELHNTAHISDDLWQALCAEWETAQLLEIIALVGWYHLIAFVANAAQVPKETWAARFPA